jgi:tryptophan-rich sensory protein
MQAGVATSVALMYAILIGVNLPASVVGLKFESSAAADRLWFEPPGYVIPLAWVVLFACLGVAHHHVQVSARAELRWYVVGLAVLCAAYAYYTLGLARLTGISSLWFGLWGNLAVIGCAALLACEVYRTSSIAAALILPVAGWTLFATAIVLGQMLKQELIGR